MPPALQSWFNPRGICSLEPLPTLRSYISPYLPTWRMIRAAGPVLGEPKLLAVVALGTDQPHHFGFSTDVYRTASSSCLTPVLACN